MYNRYATLNVQDRVTEEEADELECEVFNFCVSCKV
jgi:hypothetical protein